MNRFFLNLQFLCFVALLGVGTTATATTVPFTENFSADTAQWLNFNGAAPLSFSATDGPDNSSYASGTFNFKDSIFGAQGPVVYRGTTSVLGQSSGGAFFGNWIADGAGKLTAQVRHNAPVPLTYFTRFAAPVNFPGATAVHFAPVLLNTWTEITVDISATNPQFVTFEGSDFATVFGNIGNLQIGVSIPQALAGVDQEISFDLDQVSISAVPEPGSLVLATLACCGVLGLRRRRVDG